MSVGIELGSDPGMVVGADASAGIVTSGRSAPADGWSPPPEAAPGRDTGAVSDRPDIPASTAGDPAVAAIVDRLGLVPHPEGGWYAETWRHRARAGGRGAGTAIYYLLATGQRSHWHRVDATEIWHFYAGAPLRLRIHEGDGPTREVMLGADVLGGQIPQAIVPDGAWQSAEPTGPWVLVGCTVSPGFTFEGFDLAPAGWAPPAATA
jgi:predicted cupin superfamily sugar epimerase